MPVFNNILAGAAGQSGDAGYKVSRSLRFNPDDNAHLGRIIDDAGNRKTFTLSYWIKESGKGTSPSNNPHVFWAGADVNTRGGFVHRGTGTYANMIYLFNQESGSTNCAVYSNSSHTDFSAWKNIVWAVDTTQSNGTDRVKLYVNGVQEALNFVTTPAQNLELQINRGQEHRIGRGWPDDYGNFYLAEMHFVDGQALTAADFGEFDLNGTWNPKAFSGTYGPTAVSYSNNSQTDLSDGNVYSSTEPVKNIFDGSDTTYARINRGSNSNTVATFVWEPTGGYSGVTKLRIKYNYCSSYRINDGSWANVNNNGGYQEIYNGSAFTLNKLEIRRTDASGSDYGIFVHAIEINDSLVANVGSNGFFLDFSDSSSVAALGNDAAGSNNWTVANFTGPLDGVSSFTSTSINNPEDILDGDTSTYGLFTAQNGVFDATCNITGITKLEFHLYKGATGGNGTVGRMQYRVNGGTYQDAPYDQSNGNDWVDATSLVSNGTLTSFGFKLNGQPNGAARAARYETSAGGPFAILYTPEESRDSLPDTPTNYTDGATIGGNYATINPLNKGSDVILQNGNLHTSVTSGTATWVGRKAFSTFGVKSGKWYAEMTAHSNSAMYAAICGNTENIDNNSSIGWQSQGFGYYSGGILVYQQSENQNNPTWTTGDTIGIALDADNLKVKWYKNGTQVGASAGQDITAGKTWFFAWDCNDAGSASWNFGQRPFQISSVPAGHKALCSTTLDDPAVENPAEHFATRLWTGNGGTQIVGGGVRYSDYVTGSIDSSNPATQAFDGITNNVGVRTTTASGVSITFQPPTPLAFSSSFKLYCARDGTSAGNTFVVHHAGGSTDFTSYVATGTTQTAVELAQISGVTSPISKIVVSSGGSNPRFAAIEIDGTVLVDSTAEPVAFSPSLVWIKNRTDTSHHHIYDTLRGVEKRLTPSSVNPEDNFGSSDPGSSLTSFNSDGFTVGDFNGINGSNDPVVGWAWNAGTATTYAAGSLNSSVYNQTQNWTNNISSTSGITSGHEARLFNGILTGSGADIQSSSNGVNGVINFTNAITGSKIEVFTLGNVGQIGVNGNNLTVTSLQWVDTGVTSLTSIETRCPSAGNIQNLCGLRVDGKILVDSGLSVTNVPSLASTNRVNQSAGISITTYSGVDTPSSNTVSHGLNTKPALWLIKNRSDISNWTFIYNFTDGSNDYLFLNLKQGASNQGTPWDTQADSNVITLGANDTNTCNAGDDYVMYAFAPVDQFSAFGTYHGNSSSSGPFIFTGFRVTWLMVKKINNTDANSGWHIYDAKRDTDNTVANWLLAEANYYENRAANNTADMGGYYNFDFLSNGFRPVHSSNNLNQSGSQYVYMAFAESPLKYARAR